MIQITLPSKEPPKTCIKGKDNTLSYSLKIGLIDQNN